MKTRSILKAQYLPNSALHENMVFLYLVERQKKPYSHRNRGLSGAWLILIALAVSLLVVSACGGATPAIQPPAGAAVGLNTFIYFFTEN